MQNRAFAFLLAILFILMAPMCALAAPTDMPTDMAGAKAAVLVEQTGGQVVASYAGDEKMPVAGLARLPGLLAVCQATDEGRLKLDTPVIVSEAAAGIKGPTAFLSAREEIEAASLLKAAVMITAGDAICALAETAYGSATACIQWINDQLTAMGIEAVYTDLLGTDIHLSANDLAVLGRALMASPTFVNYSGIFYDSITHPDGRLTELASSNRLLKSAVGCNGVATGSSADAGYCGVFSISRGGVSWICAIIGAPNSAARFAAAGDLLDYGFAAYDVKTLAKEKEVLLDSVPVLGAKHSAVALVAGEERVLLLERGAACKPQWDVPEALEAPLSDCLLYTSRCV